MSKKLILILFLLQSQLFAQNNNEKDIRYWKTPFTYETGLRDDFIEELEEHFYYELTRNLTAEQFWQLEKVGVDILGNDDLKFIQPKIDNICDKRKAGIYTIANANTEVLVHGQVINNNTELSIQYIRFDPTTKQYYICEAPDTPKIIKLKQNSIEYSKSTINGYFEKTQMGRLSRFIEKVSPNMFKNVAPIPPMVGKNVSVKDSIGNITIMPSEIVTISSSDNCENFKITQYPTVPASKTFEKWLSDYNASFGRDMYNSGYALFYMNTDAVLKALDLTEGWNETTTGTNYVNVVKSVDAQIIHSMGLFGKSSYLTYCEKFIDFQLGILDYYKNNILPKYGEQANLSQWIENKGKDFKLIKSNAIDEIANAMQQNCSNIQKPQQWNNYTEQQKIAWIKGQATAFRKCKDDKFINGW